MTTKNSFVLYTEYAEHLDLLTDAQCGVLFRAIIAHETGRDLPDMDAGVRMAFSFIRARLDKDSETYAKKCEQNRRNASAGGKKWAEANSSENERPQATATDRKRPLHDNDNDSDNENDKDKKRVRRFTPPTVEEVRAYCMERGNNADPERFVDFYAAKGWKVGNQPMKDWKACVRTWEGRDRAEKQTRKDKNAFNRFDQREYTESDLEAMLVEVS